MTHDIPTFGRWLKRLRAEQDLTQEALAEIVGCASQTIRMYESGARRPSRELAERLAMLLHVPTEQHPTFIQAARAKAATSAPSDEAPAPPPLPPVETHNVHSFPPLPVTVTMLIGRQHEVTHLTKLLREPTTRILTVVGPGGVGKTRLALQVAQNMATEFRDGAAFVSLAAVLDPNDVASACIEGLGQRIQASSSPEDQLVNTLRERQMLLVVDNFEHLLEASSLLTRIIATAPGVQLLITSRNRLRLQAEHVVELGGLTVPNDTSSAAIVHADAVLLFIDRAQRVQNDFSLSPQNQHAIAEICRRLDGLPLAVELAAAQISFLPPATLLRRLDQALLLLEGGARDLPERQRTMRSAIAWSYQLLQPGERLLFHRLAAFTGTWSLEAAEAVGAENKRESWQVLGLIRGLLEKSLVIRETHGDDVRFRLLEPIRQFALEQLEDTDEASAVHDRHADYYLALAQEAYEGLRGPSQVDWINRLDTEYPNIQRAMLWLLEQHDLTRAVDLSYGILLFLWLRGHLGEGRRWLERGLKQATDQPSAVRAKAMMMAGRLAYGQGDYRAADPLMTSSMDLFRTMDEPALLAQTISVAGLVAAGLGDLDRAVTLMAEGVDRYVVLDDKFNAALLLTYWAAIPLNQGDYAEATRLTERALPFARATGERMSVYTALFNLATIALSHKDLPEAERLFKETLHLSVEMGDEGNAVFCIEGLAGVAASTGDIARAATLWGAAAAFLAVREAAAYAYSVDRTRHDQMVADARTKLPSQVWQEHWARGQAMPLKEAIERALQDR